MAVPSPAEPAPAVPPVADFRFDRRSPLEVRLANAGVDAGRGRPNAGPFSVVEKVTGLACHQESAEGAVGHTSCAS